MSPRRLAIALGCSLSLGCGRTATLARGEAGAGTRGRSPVDASLNEGGASRGIGTVREVTYTATCPSTFRPPIGATRSDGTPNPNFRCATLTVSCPQVADMTATVALAAVPPGKTARGAIVTHGPDDGTAFFGGALPEGWFEDGFDIAQVAWETPWECPRGSGGSSIPSTCDPDETPLATRPGLLDVACRPATVFAWIHDAAEVREGTRFQPEDEAFCGFGMSAGSGAFWYSLLHFGLHADLDYVAVSASTPYARIDIGCDPSYASSKIATPCRNLSVDPLVPEQYDANGSTHAGLIDNWSSTTSCDGAPSSAELAYWRRNSIVSPGARYDIPTKVASYDCIDPARVDDEPGMNAYVFAELHEVDPSGVRFEASCVLSGTDGARCTGEGALDGDGMLQQKAARDMEDKCVPIPR